MKRPREVLTEVVCSACDGTGFQKVKQPTQPGRKIYPPKCTECCGKGRIKKPAATSANNIITSDRRQRRPYPKVLPKHRNPKNPAETWSGRGKQPRWLTAQLRSGKNDPPSRANIKTIVIDFVKRLWPGRNLGCLGYSRSTRYALAARGVDIRTLQCPNCADFPMRLGPRSLPT